MTKFINSNEFQNFSHSMFDNAPISVDFLDKDGKMLYINKSFSNFLKIPVDNMIGRVVTDINPGSLFLETLKSKKAEVAVKYKFPHGNEVICDRISILDNAGKLVGGFGMLLLEDTSKLNQYYSNSDLMKKMFCKANKAIYTLDDIIGKSDEINKCKNIVRKTSKLGLNVLITGESGTGKELFAHSIHNNSDRFNKPFVCVNCSAIPENLMESEFFGYTEGAFTGAKKGGTIGKFQLANGGTIFLDEIGDMPYYMQAKLLRVLESREIVPIGGNTSIPIDVRIISATNKNLLDMVNSGKFRDDLYYRLNVINIDIPPLRKRLEDVPGLINTFLISFYKNTGIYKKIENKVIDLLLKYSWPGNIRELKNVVIKSCIAADGTLVKESNLPDYILFNSMQKKEEKYMGLNDMMENYEEEIIKNTLKQCSNNKSEAAKILRIPRISLYRKIKKFEANNIKYM